MLAVSVMTILVTSVQAIPATADTLVVHYYRYDQDYAPWSLWLWQASPDKGEGSQFNFDSDDAYGTVLTLSLAGTALEGSDSVGFIVRDADWNKDVAADRFIDMDSPNASGEVHVYLVQSNPTVYYDINDADTSDKIFYASFSDENTINFALTKTITSSALTLYADDILVTTTNFYIKDTSGTIDVTGTVDLSKVYRLEIDFGGVTPASAVVGFDGLYSSETFNDQFGYDGELGAIYSAGSTTFKLWAPISSHVTLNLYTKGHVSSILDDQGVAGVDAPYSTLTMTKFEKGVWSVTVTGDLNNVYYTFTVTNGLYENEVMDTYAKAAGVNGKRGMVVDFDAINPDNWASDVRPDTMLNYTDAIIYEIHVRDYTSHSTWNGTETLRGKFLGLVEAGTTYQNVTTGFDHIKELGVTHVQLVPVFDHGIIDETRLNDETYYGIHDGIFNWGYMPENFNVIEGSYSTDPYNGDVRITEFKQMVQAFHDNDIRVIMDVVYNHTGKSADSNFDMILPGYYFRMNPDGSFSNGSGTGNETASERMMFRKFMIDSILFYVNEYHIDGFRFDLMKLHDVETMNAIVDAVHAVDPTIIIFGEPWIGGTSTLPLSDAAFNSTLDEMPGVAVFNDDTRDGIKGSVFAQGDKGFIQGNNYADSRVLLGITGATLQANLPIGALPKGPWAFNPTQTINYVTAHDNNTLYDKLKLSAFVTEPEIIRMQRQANAIVLTSQGIPFLHGGVEILRTKPCTPGGDTCDSAERYDHNSYKSPDETNQIDWNLKVDNIDTFNYYKDLIALRKMKSVFRIPTKAELAEHITIIPESTLGFVSFFLSDPDDAWKTIYILHNNGETDKQITLQNGTWNVIANTDGFGVVDETEGTIETLYVQAGGETITMTKNETLIMYSVDLVEYVAIEVPTDNSFDFGLLAIISGSVTVLGVAIFFVLKKGLLIKK